MTDEDPDEQEEADEVSPAEALYQSMNVPELRNFCSENGIKRERGMSKADTCRAAVDQNEEAVRDVLGLEEPVETYDVMCSCGLAEEYEDEDEAIEAAKSHKGQNISHDVKAWSPKGVCVYGRD